VAGKTKKKAKGSATIGIDIGGTKSLYALFDDRFEVLADEKFRTHQPRASAAAFERCHDKAMRRLLREAAKRKLEVRAVGVAFAGLVDMADGTVRKAPNLEFLEGFPFQERVAKATGARVFVCNDVQAALYGEVSLGAAKGGRHVLGIWLGTGIGGALVIDGRMHLGASGIAGDIGNYLLQPVDAATDAPRKEILDNVASRTAVAGAAAALAAKRWAKNLRRIAGTDVRDITSGSLAKAVKQGDKAVEKLVRSRAALVGTVLSNFVDFINPDTIVLGGGLTSAMPKLIRREVEKAIEAHATPRAAKAVRVVTAKLQDHSGTAGAARLALDMYSGAPPIDLEASTAPSRGR